MSWTSRVIWEEGMFLRAQHFQQQDRWAERYIQARTAALGPYWWGMDELAINRNALSIGQFALQSGSGVFRDGTPFTLPGGDALDPPPLELREHVRDAVVYLALATPPAHAIQVGDPTLGDERRLNGESVQVVDTHSGSPEPANLVVGRLRLRFLLGEEDRAGYQTIALAKIRDVSPDRRVTLDDDFIPPVMACRSVPALSGLINELVGKLNQRCEELAGRLTGGGAAEQSDFLMLQTSNRWLAMMRHHGSAAVLHPERLYEALVQMAGEFATFWESRRGTAYAPYRHEDLQASFAPVVGHLRHLLAMAIGFGVEEIKLQELKYGVRRGVLTDRAILQKAAFYLVVKADISGEQIRRLFPSQVKIGAIEEIRELVASAVSGIVARPLPMQPRRLPFLAGAVYFELDRGSTHWQRMQNTSAFGIHVSNEFPGLQMQLWAVQG